MSMSSFLPSAEVQSPSWLCYCLRSTTSNATYVGQTKDFARRFREHKKNKRRFAFVPLVCVEGLSTQRSAIQLERAWKKAKSKAGYKKWRRTNQITKSFARIFDLFFVLNQKKWTNKSPPTSEFNLKIVCFDFVLAQNPIFIRLSSNLVKLNSLLIEEKSHFSLCDILVHYKNKIKNANNNQQNDEQQRKSKRTRETIKPREKNEKKDLRESIFKIYSLKKKIRKSSDEENEENDQVIDLTI